MAAERVLPPSTELRVPVRIFWNILFSCWLARISRHCTSGKPASIITENCRVKTASSLAVTLPPKVGKLNSLPFSDIFVGVICWRLSSDCSSVLLAATTSPATDAPERLVPRYVKTGMTVPPQRSKFLANFRLANPSLMLGPHGVARNGHLPRGGWRRDSTVNHVLQLIGVRRSRHGHVQSNLLLEISIGQALIEGLHTSLPGAGLHRGIDLVNFVFANQVTNGRRGYKDFH